MKTSVVSYLLLTMLSELNTSSFYVSVPVLSQKRYEMEPSSSWRLSVLQRRPSSSLVWEFGRIIYTSCYIRVVTTNFAVSMIIGSSSGMRAFRINQKLKNEAIERRVGLKSSP